MTGPEKNDDFPARVADALEGIAQKARSLTVGRAETIAKWGALGILLFTLALLAIIFLFIGTARLLGETVGNQELGYAIIGGLFLGGALLLWRMRGSKDEELND